MYFSIWHLLIEQLAAAGCLGVVLYYGFRDPSLRLLKGGWFLVIAFSLQLVLFLYPTMIRPLPPRLAVVVHALEQGALLLGLFLVIRDLANLKIMRNALEDSESGLPNRSEWERRKRRLLQGGEEDWWEVEVLFSEIDSIRDTPRGEVERAFFDWIGSIIIRKYVDRVPGYVARTGIRTLGFLIQADEEDTGLDRIEQFLSLLRSDVRAGGFAMEFSIRMHRPESTVF